MSRFVNVSGGGLDEVEVHQPILIVVDPPDTGAHGFEIVLLVGLRGVLKKVDSGGLANIGVADSDGSVLRLRGLLCFCKLRCFRSLLSASAPMAGYTNDGN